MITIQQEVLQNLKDAGCDETAVEDISAALRKNDRCAALRLLERQRRQLLDEVHRTESRICCLDYLMHELKKDCFCCTEDKDGE